MCDLLADIVVLVAIVVVVVVDVGASSGIRLQ